MNEQSQLAPEKLHTIYFTVKSSISPYIHCSVMAFICTLIKHPARDACLCIGGNQAPLAPAAPPAPHFVFLITVTVGWTLFKFGRCMQ